MRPFRLGVMAMAGAELAAQFCDPLCNLAEAAQHLSQGFLGLGRY
jgi:hypothetical protein